MFTIKEGTAPDKIGEGTDDATKASIRKWLESDGSTIRSTEEDESFIQSKVQSEVDASYRNQNNKFDEFVKELTGVSKQASEKTTDYMKRTLSGKLESIVELEKKVAEFEKNGLDGNAEALRYKTELETSQAQVATLREEYEEKLTAERSGVFKMKVDADIERAMIALRANFREDVDENIMKDIVENRLTKFHTENKAVEFEGHIIYQGADGKTINGKKDGKPMNTSELVSGYFEDMKRKNSAGGAGSGTGEGGTGGARTHAKISLPADVKTKVQLMDHLTNVEKMDESTKEFSEAFAELGEGMSIK